MAKRQERFGFRCIFSCNLTISFPIRASLATITFPLRLNPLGSVSREQSRRRDEQSFQMSIVSDTQQ